MPANDLALLVLVDICRSAGRQCTAEQPTSSSPSAAMSGIAALQPWIDRLLAVALRSEPQQQQGTAGVFDSLVAASLNQRGDSSLQDKRRLSLRQVQLLGALGSIPYASTPLSAAQQTEVLTTLLQQLSAGTDDREAIQGAAAGALRAMAGESAFPVCMTGAGCIS